MVKKGTPIKKLTASLKTAKLRIARASAKAKKAKKGKKGKAKKAKARA
jgi:hypothetical protein